MTQDSLKQAIAKSQQRLESLLHRATGEISAALLQEAIAEVSHNLEELQVLAEELETQNDELTATSAAIEAERQRYQDLFNITPDVYLVTDGAGIIQEANPAAAQLLDTKQSYLVGKPLAVFVHPKQRRQFRQILAQLGQQEQIREQLRMFHSARNIDFPAQLTGVAMRDTQGKLVSLCFLLRDISDRILAQESDNLVRTMIESEPECVKLMARDGTLLDMNPAGLAMIEAESLAQVQGKSVYPLVVSEYRPAFQALTERVFQGDSGILEFEILGLKGTRRWLETHATPFRNTKGEIAAFLSVTRDISDRKRLEIELQQSEAKLSNILNSAIAAIVSFRVFPNRDWQYIYWSAGCELVFGFTSEEFMADKTLWSSRVFPEDWETVVQAMFEDIFLERSNVAEYRFFDKGGSWRWVRETYTSVRNIEANCWIVTTVATDISDRKHIEAALAEKEAQLRLITDNLPAYISYLDAAQRYQFVNKMYSLRFGLTPEQICGRHIRQILGEDAYKVVQANIEQALAGTPITYEAALPDPQQGTRYNYVTLLPDIGQDSHIRGCYSLILDITERKRLELALQQSEAKLNDILNNAIASIVSIRLFADATWEYDYYSPNCEAIFGFTSEEMMRGIWWSRIPPEDQESILIPAQQYLFAQQPTRMEYRFLHKDGTIRWISSDMSSRWDEANRCFRVIAVDIDISDRKCAEAALAASEKKLRGVLNTAGAAIARFRVYTNRNWEYEFYSAGTLQLFGYTPEEMKANKTLWIDRVHPEDLQNIILPGYEDIFAGGTVTHEFRFQRRDGIWIWVSETLISHRDESLDCWLVTCIEVDISDRKQAEDKLAKMSTALSNAVEGISFLDTQGRYVTANQAYANMVGYSTAEMIGMLWHPTVHPDDLEMMNAAYQQMLTSGKVEAEARGIRKDGSMFYKQIVMVAAWDNQKQLIGHYCFMKDISDRKNAELALQRQAQQKEVLNRVIQTIRNSLDLNAIFQTATAEIAQLFSAEESYITQYLPKQQIWRVVAGYQENLEMPNKTGLEIPDPENPVTAKLKKLEIFQIWDANILADEVNQELAQTCPGSWLIVPLTFGESVWGSLNLLHSQTNIIWNDERVELARAVADQLAIAIQQANLYQQLQQELSDRKQAEIELQKAKESAEAANVAKSTFLANMSHELRTPLNAILGFTQMMARDTSLSPKQQEQVKIINNAGDHLLALINDILEMSKIEAGRTNFNPTSFDLIHFLSTLEELFKFKAESKGLQLKFELAPHLPQYIQTDEGKLRQVLINIIGNAIKFTEKGQVTLRITQGNHQKNTNYQLPTTHYQLIFEIQDTGFGIKPEEIDRIFDPFIQSETGKNTMEGTGLGLAISRKFVQMMGGNIRVKSQPNQGSLFTFDIQVSLAEAIEQNTNQTPRQVIGLAPNQPEYRILVVEDHPESRLLLTTLLSSIGFQVRQAYNGQEAIEIWSTWKPDLICMDMRMPVINGIEATQQIRAREKELLKDAETRRNGDGEKVFITRGEPHYQTIIIALTANAFESDKKFVLAAGCDDYISKPFQQDIVLQKIGQYLEITYLYESENNPTDKANQNTESKITTEQLKTLLDKMPVDWLLTLHKNAYIGDDSIIFELLKKIPPEDAPLAKALADLTFNFEFDKIIELTQT